jgi:hypothetical protein
MSIIAVTALLLAELSPEQLAKVQHDRQKAMAEVSKKYGDKKPSELTQDERREMIHDQREAEDRVLEKNGVDRKEIARYEAKLSLDDRAATKAAKQQIEEKEKREADEKAKGGEKQGGDNIPIQRGFSDTNPVTLEDKGNGSGGPVVERGLPQDAQDDYNAAGAAKGDESAPEPKSKGKKK